MKCAPSTRTAARASPPCSRARPGRRSSTSSSTCSRWRASRSSTCRSSSAESGSRSCSTRGTRPIRFSESFDDGRALLRAAKQQKLEGIMAKRLESKYLPGKRTRDWLKIKPHGRQEFVIAGYTKGQGRRSGTLGSLVLGAYRGAELVYVGNVGTGFTDQEIERLLKVLKPLQRKTSRPSASSRRCRGCARATSSGSSRSWWPRSSSSSGRTTAGYGRPPTRGFVTTRTRATCASRSRWRPRSARASASSSSRTSTSPSGPRRASPRATSSRTTSRWPARSSRT